VDVRIGVTYSAKEIDIEMADDADRKKLRSQIEAALADDGAVLWLTDRRGRDVGVPSEKIAYIEIGSSDSERRIGFGS
jgi:hypothetical protein